jgi:hypothetical protein
VEDAAVTEEHVSSRRWHLMGWRPQQMKEAAGSVLQWFLAVDGGSVVGLAWLKGARVVHGGHRLEQRGMAMKD